MELNLDMKINISVDESSYLLGYSKRKTFMNIYTFFEKFFIVCFYIDFEIIRELPKL